MNNASNSIALNEAQKLILEFVNDYFDEKTVANVEKALKECPVHFVDPREDNFMGYVSKDTIYDRENIGGYASNDGIFLPKREMSYSKEDEFGRDATIGLIIHEYAHILRKINSDYGNMFEEGFATVFAESCIIHSELKKQAANGQKLEQISVLSYTSYKYKKAESQIRSILYILNQNGLDMQLIGEYIFGDQMVFKQKCIEIFGEDFASYFDLANSKNDQYYNDYDNKEQNSEIMLINIISDYIKQKGLNISDFWDKNHILQYNTQAETLSKAVVNTGISSIREEDREAFKLFESSAKMITQDSDFAISERIDRIKEVVVQNYSLSGKSKEEIYGVIEDLCSEYVQRKNSDRKENQLFIEELKRLIPNIEEFTKSFVELRHFTASSSLFEGIDLSNGISYQQIESYVSSLLKQYKIQQQETLEADILKKEQELLQLKSLESKHNASLQIIEKQYKVLKNEEKVSTIISQNNELNESLSEKQQDLDNENQRRIENQSKKEDIFSKKIELENKNIIIRLLNRKKIKKLSLQITVLEQELNSSDMNLDNLRTTVSSLQGKINDNEHQMVELCGLKVSEYMSILEECKTENMTQEQLLEKASQIKMQIDALEISKHEQELQELYKNNGIVKQEEIADGLNR